MSDSGTPSQPLVYIIILNWNLPNDTVECVESVLRSDYPNLKILVVDNASSDNSVEVLQNRFQNQIEILQLEKNHGFGQGNNFGIKLALERNAEYTLLINNDTVIDPAMVSELVACAETDPSIGIVGPLIFYADKPETIWFSGMRFWKQLYVVQRGLHFSLTPHQRFEYVDFISGCGMLVKRRLWHEIGLFSPDYYMYYEDIDLCLRAKKSGFRLITATKAKMWHKVSASSGGSTSPLKQYFQVKSSLIFYKQHTQGIWRWLNLSIRVLHAIWTSFKYILSGQLNREMIHLYLTGIKEFANEQQSKT